MKLLVFRGISVLLLAFLFVGQTLAQTAWEKVESGTDVDLITVFFTSSDKGWIGGDNGFLAFTRDEGQTWTKFPLRTDENINEIYFRNEKNGYLVAGRKMFLTSDGGSTWGETVLVRAGEIRTGTPEFLSIRFANKKLGIIVGSILNTQGDVIDSLILRTDDEGSSWQRINVPSNRELYHLDFVGDSRVWVVGDHGLIMHSGDGGKTWSTQFSGTEQPLFNVDFRDSKAGYAVGYKGTILRTENGGITWEKVPTNFPNTFMRVDFADDKNGWIVGHGGTILRSGDRGKTWLLQESGVKESLFGLYMVKRYGWALGGNGTLLRLNK